MLEEKIDSLTKSIDILNALIDRMWEGRETIPGVPVPPISAPIPEPKEEPKAKEVVGSISHDELHKLCLSIVRDKPNAKAAIQKILSKRLVKELSTEELPAIKAELEKL